MGRKINSREQRRPQTRVVGAGITEYWYLKHLKPLLGLKFELHPRLFGNESAGNINKLIKESLDMGAPVICLFDEDVTQWNEKEAWRIDDLHRKYDNHEKVTLCGSMPSIEYWFLLHYENTDRYLKTSHDATCALRRYVPQFVKKESFLRRPVWVRNLVEEGRTDEAIKRARKSGRQGESYTDVWKAIIETSEK